VNGYDGFEPTRELQASVNRDLQRILEYGELHPSDYGGRWLQDRHNYGVSFARSVDGHKEALAEDLELPERLLVRRCSFSYRHMAEIQMAIEEEEMKRPPNAVTLVAPDAKNNVLRVGVLPGHPDVERRLNDRYGSLISIEEGGVAQAF
jgi:hypothetical protein